MSKTIILHSIDGPVASHLRQCGYEVIDIHQAQRQGIQAAAILRAGYRPDSAVLGTCDFADRTIGCIDHQDISQPLTINVTGHSPQQVQALLESHLQHQER